jgi:hypothetical protein
MIEIKIREASFLGGFVREAFFWRECIGECIGGSIFWDGQWSSGVVELWRQWSCGGMEVV